MADAPDGGPVGGRSVRRVLVVGGTGMLRPAAHDLASGDTEVIVAARRPDRVHDGRSSRDQPTSLVPVAADWSDPASLAAGVSAAAGGPVDEAILWVHHPYTDPVMAAVDTLLTDAATVVHVWGSATSPPPAPGPPPPAFQPPRRYRRLLLGFADDGDGARWLTHREISDGALLALGPGADDVVVGKLHPWSDRPGGQP